MNSKYPANWREVKNHDGITICHERSCGNYRLTQGLDWNWVCDYLPDGFEEVEIGRISGLSAAMAYCRSHKDELESKA